MESVRWQQEQKVGIFLLFFAYTNKINKTRIVSYLTFFTILSFYINQEYHFSKTLGEHSLLSSGMDPSIFYVLTP